MKAGRRLVAAVIASVLFAACAKQQPAAPGTKVIRISQRNEPADLDPATASLPDEFFIIRALSEGLLVPNPSGGEPLPAAAASYDVSSDGLVYTFHLRPNAHWSNGEPVTAGDFIWSWQRVLTPATAAPKAQLFYDVKNARAFVAGKLATIDAVGFRAVDPETIRITLEHPSSNFLRYVAAGPWIPVNRHALAAGRTWTSPGRYVGNGPFILTAWQPQQRIVVRRNSHYRDAAKVRVDELQFIRFDNQDAEERAFRAGQIDVTMAVPQAKLDVYQREHPEELHRAPLAETRFLAFNIHRPPLNDVRVRRALSLALDREKLVTRVLRGGQAPAERFLSPPLRAATQPEGARVGAEVVTALQRSDPAAARRLLADAGFSGGQGFPRLELSGWDRNPILEAMQQMWKQELGIEIALTVREAKVHLAAMHAGDFDVAFATNLLDVLDATAALADFTTSAPNNFPHWHSADFDRFIAASFNARSPADAAAANAAAEQALLAAAPVAPVYFNAQNWLMSPRVHGWEQDALWSRRYNDLTLDP